MAPQGENTPDHDSAEQTEAIAQKPVEAPEKKASDADVKPVEKPAK